MRDRLDGLEREETTGVLVILTVPKAWVGLSVAEIERKLGPNLPLMLPAMAEAIHRWAGTAGADLSELRKFLDERLA